MASVLRHFLGVESLEGVDLLDVGCSAGIVGSVLAAAGASVRGVDIDLPALSSGLTRPGPALAAASCLDLPFPDESLDVVVANHVYEHTTEPARMMSEIRRVLRPEGVVFLGLGNRFAIMEPHYRLPFLSWLPRFVAHRYLRVARHIDRYHERFLTPSGLRKLLAGWNVWDYTIAVIASPAAFAAECDVPPLATSVPPVLLRSLRPLIPTYLWVAAKSASRNPRGPVLAVGPTHVEVPPE